ncbi:hypothetical protein P6F00_002810 [Salmonella enterica]|nr:hypothetical protein [Salmonella enterica]
MNDIINTAHLWLVILCGDDNSDKRSMIRRKWSFFKFWFMQGGIGRSLFDRFFQKKRAENL